MQTKGEIIIFENSNNETKLDVKLIKESVWLTQNQMATLFGKDTDTIGLHIKNIYRESELVEKSTTEDYSVVQLEGNRRINRKLKHYNLDMIISVGYRVNSIRGTKFRIWATKILKEHLIKGFSVNAKRLKELNQNIELIKRAVDRKGIDSDEKAGLLDLILNYTKTWVLLNEFDEKSISIKNIKTKSSYELRYKESKELIELLKSKVQENGKNNSLFGNEIDLGLERILKSINQTFDKKNLYQSLEEKASHLLYFIIKDHPFSDGNKRIASLLFIIYLNKNKFFSKNNGNPKIDENALVVLALLIAESKPSEKDSMISLIMNLLVD